jgi:hypothetical protein
MLALVPLVAGLLIVASCDPEPGPSAQERPASADVATPAPGTDGPGTRSDPAVASGDAPWTMPAVPESIAEGIRVYRANYCGTCHRSSLAGTAGIFGPGHDSLGVDAARWIRDPSYSGRAATPPAYVRESIVEPLAWRVPGYERTRFVMPAYTELTDSELDALVRMLLWEPSSEGER